MKYGSKGLSKVEIAYTTLREASSEPGNSSKGFRPMMNLLVNKVSTGTFWERESLDARRGRVL